MPISGNLSALYHHRSAKIVLASLLAVVAVTLAIFTARRLQRKPGPQSPANIAAAQQSPAATPTPSPLGQLLITVRPTGFDPQEIVQPKGEFLLAVDNRSGLKAINLRLEAERGKRLRSKRVPREQLDWRELVYLDPGSYLLKETKHPNWVCRIRVTNK
jgi:hypothetical protein